MFLVDVQIFRPGGESKGAVGLARGKREQWSVDGSVETGRSAGRGCASRSELLPKIGRAGAVAFDFAVRRKIPMPLRPIAVERTAEVQAVVSRVPAELRRKLFRQAAQQTPVAVVRLGIERRLD